MSQFDSIDEALNVESEIVKAPKTHDLSEVNDVKVEKVERNDRASDYEYSRAQLYSLIEKGQEAVNGALELANEGDSGRNFEVALNGVKTISEVTEKLIDLQKKMKELDEVQVTNNQTNVTNNSVFVGSTTELQKMIKQGMLNKLSDSE